MMKYVGKTATGGDRYKVSKAPDVKVGDKVQSLVGAFKGETGTVIRLGPSGIDSVYVRFPDGMTSSFVPGEYKKVS